MCATAADRKLRIVSFNLHGLNQGKDAIEEIVLSYEPDIILLQEHWLTPANLSKLDVYSNYFLYGSSAMNESVAAGPLYGRPFGGVAALISKSIQIDCSVLFSCERFLVLKILNCVIVNVYMPAQGSADRYNQYETVLNDILYWRQQYPDSDFLLGGDLNVDLNGSSVFVDIVNDFCITCGLSNCYSAMQSQQYITFVSEALGHSSLLDYFLYSQTSGVVAISVLDIASNFSDHLPVLLEFVTTAVNVLGRDSAVKVPRDHRPIAHVDMLRWDHADVVSYYEWCRVHLAPIFDDVNRLYGNRYNVLERDACAEIERITAVLTLQLLAAAKLFVPKVRQNFFKFWWDADLSALKQASLQSDTDWKAAGKPRSGPIFQCRQQCRAAYRRSLRQKGAAHRDYYSNALHNSLANKEGASFWRCWRSKFGEGRRNFVVEGSNDESIVNEKFKNYFEGLVSSNSHVTAAQLKTEFDEVYQRYSGYSQCFDDVLDSNLVGDAIDKLQRGKAADIDGIQSEHLIYCHPIVTSILLRLFNSILFFSYLPASFRTSYTVPLPKVPGSYSKSMTCTDFRGIAISSLFSKILEHCLLRKFSGFLSTSNRQFGFKKLGGCSNAIFTARSIIDNYIDGGSTANLLALDISKAFDKVNHCALFLKLVKRNVPLVFLRLLVNWLPLCITCVKWGSTFSRPFSLGVGVRQGSVLAPVLFAIYIDDVIQLCVNSDMGEIVVYADDILLIARTVYGLQCLFNIAERYLLAIDLALNCGKSYAMRVGRRHSVLCLNVSTSAGGQIPWVQEMRYLGIFWVSSGRLKCSFTIAKRKFNIAANSIYSKVNFRAGEDVTIYLLKTKCLPILLYGTEACSLAKSELQSLDFVVIRFIMKLFRTNDRSIIDCCLDNFNFSLPSNLIVDRQANLERRIALCDGAVCHMYRHK